MKAQSLGRTLVVFNCERVLNLKGGLIGIRNVLPHTSKHVVKAEVVGLLKAYLRMNSGAIVTVPSVIRQWLRGCVGSPGLTSVFPFSLCLESKWLSSYS